LWSGNCNQTSAFIAFNNFHILRTATFARSLDLDAEAAVEEDVSGDGELADLDEVSTKLDLARAYIDMGDPDGAKSILDEVLDEGNDQQKDEAKGIMEQIS